jgi:hypothetical protein
MSSKTSKWYKEEVVATLNNWGIRKHSLYLILEVIL